MNIMRQKIEILTSTFIFTNVSTHKIDMLVTVFTVVNLIMYWFN
jgi:hypothetical protein